MLLLDLFKRVESSSYNMSCAGDDLLSLNFQNDVCNLKSYIEKRLKKNDLWKILHLSDPTVSPSLYAKLRLSQATSVSIERSFSMLKKMLRTDRNFLNDNIEKYVILYYNTSTKKFVKCTCKFVPLGIIHLLSFDELNCYWEPTPLFIYLFVERN